MEYGTAISCKKQNFMTYNGNMLFHVESYKIRIAIICITYTKKYYNH